MKCSVLGGSLLTNSQRGSVEGVGGPCGVLAWIQRVPLIFCAGWEKWCVDTFGNTKVGRSSFHEAISRIETVPCTRRLSDASLHHTHCMSPRRPVPEIRRKPCTLAHPAGGTFDGAEMPPIQPPCTNLVTSAAVPCIPLRTRFARASLRGKKVAVIFARRRNHLSVD